MMILVMLVDSNLIRIWMICSEFVKVVSCQLQQNAHSSLDEQTYPTTGSFDWAYMMQLLMDERTGIGMEPFRWWVMTHYLIHFFVVLVRYFREEEVH